MSVNWLKLSSVGDKTRYRKELLRTGRFTKDSDGIEFTVNELFLDHLHSTNKEMIQDGIKVPAPMGHNETDENNKGWLVETEREGESLYGIFEINGVSEEELANYDVSVYVPPKFVAGNGKTYMRPIKHAALTAYPVIPGLDRFEAIAASLVLPKEEDSMAIDFVKLGTDLGIDKEMSEENAPELLLSAFNGLKAELAEAKKPIKKPEEELKELALSHPGLIKIAKEGRIAKIDALLKCEKPKISKATRDALVSLYGSEESIALSLDESETEFDRVIKILEKNDVVSLGEMTAEQVLQLSDPKKGDQEPGILVKDALRRKEAAKA